MCRHVTSQLKRCLLTNPIIIIELENFPTLYFIYNYLTAENILVQEEKSIVLYLDGFMTYGLWNMKDIEHVLLRVRKLFLIWMIVKLIFLYNEIW